MFSLTSARRNRSGAVLSLVAATCALTACQPDVTVPSAGASGQPSVAASGSPSAPAEPVPASVSASATGDPGRTGSAEGVRARPADAVVDSVGVNIHLHYDNTVYRRFDDLVAPRLRELGIRHVRDGAYTYPGVGPDSFFYQRCRKLVAQGIKVNLIVSMPRGDDRGTDTNRLADVHRWCGKGVTSFEGTNEPDLQGVADWPARARKTQRDLFAAVHADPALSNVAVYGPSVTSEGAARQLGDICASVDAVTLHNYPSWRGNESDGWGDRGYGSFAWNRDHVAKPMCADKPMVSTETGYPTPAEGADHMPENQAAILLPRLFLNQFANGVGRSYTYEFLDQGTSRTDREANFGLVRHDGSRKPAFTALKNLIATLDDRGGAFTPGKLDYRVTGNTTDLRQLLLQKRDGTFFLALWRTTQSWNGDTKTSTGVPARDLTLSVDTPRSAATAHTITAAGALDEQDLTLTGGTTTVKVGNTVTLVELNP